MNTIIEDVRHALIQNADEKTKKSGETFFKEQVRMYGVKSAAVGKIAKEFYKKLTDKNKQTIFELCDILWRSGYLEESFIACNWSYSVRKSYKPEDLKVFEYWIYNYVSNWASCDTLCNHTVGTLIELYPIGLQDLKNWARSQNRWMRRAAAVSLIIPARNGRFIEDIFEIADILLIDKDDMVRKGYGWMLKAASQVHQAKVFDYVMNNKSKMPRTSLRYAIEKMPEVLRKRAMEK